MVIWVPIIVKTANKEVMTTKPIKFSEYFNIDKSKLIELGVFDPILNHDTKLFVDPLLLKDSGTQIMREAYAGYNEFFADLMLLLKKSQQVGDRCWRAAKMKVDFPEYKYTCIGYGTGTINGSGSGAVLNDQILQSAKEIIVLAQDNPDIFLLLPLLEDGVGADIISDMTQNIIDDYICRYTIEVMDKLGIKGTYKHYSRDNQVYYLPYNEYHKCPIKLLPLDILSNLPLAETFDTWLVDLSQENQFLRAQVNKLIGVTWLDTTKSQKKETMLDLIKKDKDFFIAVLGALQQETFEPYNLEKDFDGLYRWLEDSKIFANATILSDKSLDNDVPLYETVGLIIDAFKVLIEKQEQWRMFWTDLYKKHKHVKEFYSQMLFYMVAYAWINAQGNKIAIDRAFNKENQQLEFIFTVPGQDMIKVQLKHSDNYAGLKKCYEDQIEQCNRQSIRCYYVVFDFLSTKTKQLKDILANQDTLCKIIEIDVSFRASREIGLGFDLMTPDFGDVTTQYFDIEDDLYLAEKRKGGENSYKMYIPLRAKVEEICNQQLAKQNYSSARSLCNVVAILIEEHHQGLLANFAPYVQTKRKGADWKFPTFYNWCNEIYKSAKLVSADANI